MAKPLNDLTGKGYLVNRGQDWVETYLESHTQAELAVLAGYTKNGGPNAGAVSVALKSLGWATFNGQPVAEKPVTEKQVKSVKTEPVANHPAELPGRVEDFLADVMGLEAPYTVEMVESAIADDSEQWNRLIMRLKKSEHESPLMTAFMGGEGWTLIDRAEIARETARLAPWKRAEATVAAFAAIDLRLQVAETKFESSRFDAAIVEFYDC